MVRPQEEMSASTRKKSWHLLPRTSEMCQPPKATRCGPLTGGRQRSEGPGEWTAGGGLGAGLSGQVAESALGLWGRPPDCAKVPSVTKLFT